MITSEQLNDEFQCKLSGCLWDDSWSEDYQESVTLTIREMRDVVNTFRIIEQRRPFTRQIKHDSDKCKGCNE